MEDNFWREPHRWPSDPDGYVFLARAVQRVGAAMFGENWTGNEVAIKLVEQLPEYSEGARRDNLRAALILQRNVHEVANHGRRVTSEEWCEAQEKIKLQNDPIRPSAIRVGAVRREIVKRCESGVLVSAVRPAAGGEMRILLRTVWNTEKWGQRFYMGQMNPRKPFDLGVAGDGYEWIFLTSASLETYLLGLPAAKISTADLPHVSPYLRVMIAVAKKMAITPENQPKKESVVSEIEGAWNDITPLSPHLAQAMATLLREPGSQMGRRGTLTRTRQKKE